MEKSQKNLTISLLVIILLVIIGGTYYFVNNLYVNNNNMMKLMYFIIVAILIVAAGVGGFFLIRLKNQMGIVPYEQTGQQQKLLEISTSPYGPGNSDPPGVGTQITLYRSGKMEIQKISYRQNGSSYEPVATTTVSSLQAEAVTKIEDIIRQLMSKNCAKQRADRSAELHIYWQNQMKTIESPNCHIEMGEIWRLLGR